jgi:DNA-binding response OmpR family regulator
MRKRILLVEDNNELLDILAVTFRDAGYATAAVCDGLAAIKKARSWLPDIVLLDLMLPELDGFGVCERLRHDPTTAGIPVLMHSGLSGQLSRFAGIDSGGTDFITKPASPSALVLKVGKMLDQRASRAEVQES